MTLTVKQESAALALASGRTAAEAAAEAGCSVRSLRRWLAEKDGFRERTQELRTELFGLAVGRLSELSGKAAAALGELLESEAEGIRLQAARSILEHGPKLRESTDLAAQLAQLRAEWEASKREDQPEGGAEGDGRRSGSNGRAASPGGAPGRMGAPRG